MANFRKFLPPIIAVVAISFFAIFPYNKYCAKSQSCEPILLKNIMPKKSGPGLNVEIEASNYHEFLEFKLISPKKIKTQANKTIVAEFEVKNKSNQIIYFRPMLAMEPKIFLPFLDKYQCLCMEEQSVRANETKKLKAVFAINSKIDGQELFETQYLDESVTGNRSEARNLNPKAIKIRYVIQNTY